MLKNIKSTKVLVILTLFLPLSIYLQLTNIRLFTNLINPLFWTCILAYVIYKTKSIYIRFPNNKNYFIKMLIISTLYCIIYFYLGFIFGITKSPYNHSIKMILINSIQTMIPLIGIEVIRSFIATRDIKNKGVLCYITILLFLIELKYTTIVYYFTQRELLFKYLFSTIIPLLALNMLCTYLVIKGSYKLTLTFRLFEATMMLLLPIYPSLDWFALSSLGLLTPVIIYLLFKYKFTRESTTKKREKETTAGKISYTITLIIVIFIVTFMLGFFKYEPIAILSNSMYPSYERGDVLIYEKLNDNELSSLKKGDIIIYKIGDQNIAHRVIDIVDKNGKTYYQAKGDNNNAPDLELVKPDQIVGVYIFHMKYIGYPSIWLSEYLHQQDAKVETK